MRILMLVQAYPPVIGGSERSVQELSTELVARGHEVAVATLWHEGSPAFELDQGVRVYRIRGAVHRAARLLFSDPARGHAPPFPDPEMMLSLRRIIVREQPQIVHAHDWMVHSFLPLKAWSRAKLIMTLHIYDLVCATKSLMYRRSPCDGSRVMKCLGCASNHYGPIKGMATAFGNWTMSIFERALVDMFVSVSQAVATANGLAANPHRSQVIPNFALDDADILQDDPDRFLAQLPCESYLLFVGALSRKKGIDVLLRAHASLVNAPPMVLLGYDTTEEPVALVDLPANVIVLRNWPHGAVMLAWRRCLIGLVPSAWPEPFGRVAVEAMLAGRPVIASRTGGLADIVVDGQTGFLVPPGDAIALKQAIQKLLGDATLRERMGRAGKERVAEFQAGKVVQRYERVYRELINGSEN